MSRRRLEPPPADRLAAILGMPPVAPAAGTLSELTGWVPQRASVTREAESPDAPGRAAPTGLVPSDPPRLNLGRGTLSTGRHRRSVPPKPAILTVPVALRGVRASPRRLAVLGVLVLLLTSAVVLGVRVAWARTSARPQPIAAAAHGPPGGLVTRTVPAAFASQGSSGSPTSAGVLLVHVVGQVRRPGVVRLPPGSRVLDAVQAAGGLLSSADLNHVNLARPVVDGEQILVPKPGESIPAGVLPGAAGGGDGTMTAGSLGGLIDLNSADAAALDSLPGVGPVLAQRILDWRTAHGRFTSVDELGEVTGIGDKLMAQIGPKVRV
jgi:competence protein ComEA